MNSEAMNAPVLMNEKEAAQVLGFSAWTLQRWRGNGEGPIFVRISARAVRYRRCDLDRWIEERLRTSTSDLGHDG